MRTNPLIIGEIMNGNLMNALAKSPTSGKREFAITTVELTSKALIGIMAVEAVLVACARDWLLSLMSDSPYNSIWNESTTLLKDVIVEFDQKQNCE